MTSSSRLALFFILVTCSFQQHCHHLLARADETLITMVCTKTGQFSNVCLDCLMAPGNQNLDIKGLAQASISCSASASFIARQTVAELGKNSTGQLAQNCFACVQELDEAIPIFIDAGKAVAGGRYNEGVDHLNQALNKALDCVNLVGFSRVTELVTVEGDIEVALNVVNQIPVCIYENQNA